MHLPPPPARTLRQAGAVRRGPLVLLAFAFLCVLVPGLFFYGTWYGTRLDDPALAEFLSGDASAHETRHALEEVTLRFEEGAPGMDRWASKVVEVSRRSGESLRIAAAWAMHYDSGRAEFVARLKEMLADESVLVRRAAATSLAKGRDASGLPLIRSMLEPFAVAAPAGGTVEAITGLGEALPAGGFVARIACGDGETIEVRAAVPGTVRRVGREVGQALVAGDVLLELAPDEQHVMNAVTALAIVGEPGDAKRLQAIADPRAGHDQTVQQQARTALAAIRARSGK